MEGLHDLKDRICDFDNLMEAYRNAAKGKRYRGEVLAFSFELGKNLLSIQKDLLEMTYTVGPYREFYVRYPKPRLVMALGFRDRVVQWAIYRQINPYLEKRYIDHSYGCRKEKGTLAAAQQLHRWQQLISRKPDADEWFLIKGDVAKFFYRTDHETTLTMYEDASDEAWFAWLMGTIINNPDVPFGLPLGIKPDDCPREKRLYDVGMPIGNLTSQETANLYLNAMDQYCKHDLRLHFYVRYMDDFCIFIRGREEAEAVFEKISIFLHDRLRLEISSKSRIQKATQPVEFVGYRITPHGMRMRKKTTKHVKRSLRYIANQYAAGETDYGSAMATVTCYIGMCKNCNGHNLKRWIFENIVVTINKEAMKRDELPPARRPFYTIHDNGDGTADVYLRPVILRTASKKDFALLAVKGVQLHDGLEEDIRRRFDAWCESAEMIYP